MSPIKMAKFAQQTAVPESVPGAQFFSNLFEHGAVQFQEALFSGNPIAIAAV